MRVYLVLCYILLAFSMMADGTIFVLHRFDDDRYPSTNISTEWLKKYFDYINENGYEVVSLDKINEKIKKKEEIPESWVSFTIDDAYKSFYDNGLPVFKEYKFPFTLFVLTEATDKNYPDYMNWEEINETGKYGSIGIHSYSHPHLTKISKEEVIEDTKKAMELISKNVENGKSYYAYPYGEYDENIRDTLKSLGLEAVYNQSTGGVSEKTDIYNIHRIALGNEEKIQLKLNIGNLAAKWEEVKVENDYLKSIKVSMLDGIDKVEVFLSGYGWEYADVEEGTLEFEIDKKLKLNRSRIIIRDFDNRWSSYILVK